MGRATNSAMQTRVNKPKPDTGPYIGDVMLHCVIRPNDFKHTQAIIVSGDGWNVCGHALLHVGPGWFFHVAGLHDRPRFMRNEGYQRYLRENDKREIRRTMVHIPDIFGAHRKLLDLVSRQWLWLMLPNNCATFLEQIVQAGGSRAGIYFNCPNAEKFAP